MIPLLRRIFQLLRHIIGRGLTKAWNDPILLALLIMLLASTLWLLTITYRRGAGGRETYRDGDWICPAGKNWGWGANEGKCCESNANCVSPIQHKDAPPKAGDWVCPTGKSWGWGANEGKCCKANTKCEQPIQYQPPPPKKGDWVCPTGKNWGWGDNKGQCCQDNAKCEPPIQYEPPPPQPGDWVCPPGKDWGWGKGKDLCCKAGDAECVPPKQYYPPPPKPGDWVCPPATKWGWGPNQGKCCDEASGKCGPPVQYTPPPPREGDWVCPAGKNWGWDTSNGLCCDANNKNCAPPTQFFSPPPKDGDWICPAGTGWGWGPNQGTCCKLDGQGNTNANCVPPTQYKTPPPRAGDWVCPAGTGWGWGANASACCKDNAQCVQPVQVKDPIITWQCPDGHAWAGDKAPYKCCPLAGGACDVNPIRASRNIPLFYLFDNVLSGSSIHGWRIGKETDVPEWDLDRCRARCVELDNCTHFEHYRSQQDGKMHCDMKDGSRHSDESNNLHTYDLPGTNVKTAMTANTKGRTITDSNGASVKMDWANTHPNKDRFGRLMTCSSANKPGKCKEDEIKRESCKRSGQAGGLLKWVPLLGPAFGVGQKASCAALDPDAPTDVGGKITSVIF